MYRACDCIKVDGSYSVLCSSRDRVRNRIRFSVWLVSDCARVLMLLSVVIVLYPYYVGFVRVGWFSYSGERTLQIG